MDINYKINNKIHKIIFCPDREGLKITSKKKSYTTIAKDLLKTYNDKKIVLIIDRNINNLNQKYSAFLKKLVLFVKYLLIIYLA